MQKARVRWVGLTVVLALAAGCAKHRPYFDPNMDFSGVKSVAVMPFWNLTQNQQAADRVREVFANSLLATRAVYVMPTGEVARAISRVGPSSSSAPTVEEIAKLGAMLKVDAVITGVVKEYGEVRATSAASNVVSVGVQMQECGTGKVVWSATSTKGGVTWAARLLGTSGGDPLNDTTEEAVDDLLRKLFD